jgi:HNH endonuclease
MKRSSGKGRPGGLVFRMPVAQTMVSRKSSVTNAFVNSLIPVIEPSGSEVREALVILGMSIEDVRCSYCGDPASEWDHLRPLVVNRRPTGYISEIGNLVPSCGKCNQSKGNKGWEAWMRGSARLSPASRGVEDMDIRIDRLRRYEQWKRRTPIDFASIIEPAVWQKHWSNLDEVIAMMQSSQVHAEQIKDEIVAYVRAEQGR